jgi:hypothetical protein
MIINAKVRRRKMRIIKIDLFLRFRDLALKKGIITDGMGMLIIAS